MKFEGMQESLIDDALSAAKLSTDGNVPEKAVQLSDHYRKIGGKMIVCGDCEGASPADLDSCPYCGTYDEEPDEDSKGEPPAVNNTKGDKPAEETKNMTTAQTTTTDKPNGKAPKKTDEEKAHEKEEKAKAKALAKIEPLPEGVTVDKLDEAILEVQKVKGDTAVNFHKLGQKIATIFDGQLWKARRDADGKPAYKSFKEFCQTELHMSDTHARSTMDLSKQFTAADVHAWGATKLGLLLQAPAEAREKLMRDMEKKSSRELASQVREEKAKAKADGKATHSRGERAGASGKGGAIEGSGRKSTAKITVVSLVGSKKRVKLYKKIKEGEKPLAAKTLGDGPWGRIDLGNETQMIISIVKNAKDELEMAYEVVRAPNTQKEKPKD